LKAGEVPADCFVVLASSLVRKFQPQPLHAEEVKTDGN
jgi:hypothetical protein